MPDELVWRSFASSGLLAISLVGVLALYLWHFHPRTVRSPRRLLFLASLLVLTVLAAKIVTASRPLWVFVFPLAAGSMLVSTLLDARLAIMVGMIMAVLVAWVSGGTLEVAVILSVGAATGALGVWHKERLHAFFVAGLGVAAAQAVVWLAFFLAQRSEDWSLLGVVSFELLVNGLLSALLTIGSVTLVGRLFGILTRLQLLELASPTQPLLRRLLNEAPGTYHHSIMVGNLAERAAEVVGADSLLVRVAAYYHDVGKLERPWAFIENQADMGENIHDALEPMDSAQLIAAHVVDGMALAEKYELPAPVREMIPQHHGTRTVSFFYQQAVERAGESVDPAPFTYPGPKPQSREAALLMLADSTEAAARAARDHSRPAIEGLVDQIVRERLEEGQFDDCNLTLRDLTVIKRSFVTLLSGMYHSRIPYPAKKDEDHADAPDGPIMLRPPRDAHA